MGGFILSGILHPVKGQQTAGLVEKEIAKRNTRVTEARALMTEAAMLHAKGDDEEAAKLYRQAWEMLPDAPLTAGARAEARDGSSASAIAHARQLAKNGRLGEARALLQSVLAPDFDPDNQAAKTLLTQLDDPDRFEPALTPRHMENVGKVETDLRLANGLMTLGDYDGAREKFQDVLRTDAYNSAARRGLERVEQLKAGYHEAARDQMRARRFSEVSQAWEDVVPATDLSTLFGGASSGLGAIGGAKENTLVRLRTLILPVVDLQTASLEEVVEFLRIRTRDLDPTKRGVDFVLKVAPETAAKPVSLSMVNVPVEEVLRYATEMTGTVYRADEFAVSITSRAEKSTTLIARSYRVPPDFLQQSPTTAAAPVPANPFDAAPPGGGGLQIRRVGAREFLEQRGVVFPEGAAASYNPGTNILFIRNTADNLALVDTLVEQAAGNAPKQIEIQVRMVEVNQTRLAELGFDWLLGSFNVPGSNRVFASGGAVGNQTNNLQISDFPIQSPQGQPVGNYPMTASLRGSAAIIGVPSIDSLIGRATVTPVDSRSPGAFAVSGVFTDPQFQMVIRALSQNKGVDLVTAPTVVTKSGQRAKITSVRELIYPTEYDPPQIPQSVGVTDIGGGVGVFGGASVAPVVPATPSAFEMREVGVILEVEPVVGDNNRTIELSLTPTSVEFEGFIDYGSDIVNSTVALFNNPNPDDFIVANDILQPVFRTNKVTTSVTVWDGHTVVLGGVMYERRQDIKDKVPIVGDLPIVGRAFQSRVKQVEKKNVIFFVTARVIDPAGNRVNQPVAPEEPATAGR